ncbi:hypothetical protein HMPREF3233_01020 [Veillonella atypica]|uniref:Uncharacterized protein n=1 Tax=Veillonella atypica TaxID=39777 RepID=A0A133S4S0_9FIRM|nr:hypothetical protein HMPREF3233_01020 [Veillonella atypica]
MLLLQFIILSSYKKAVNQKADSFHIFTYYSHYMTKLINKN